MIGGEIWVIALWSSLGFLPDYRARLLIGDLRFGE